MNPNNNNPYAQQGAMGNFQRPFMVQQQFVNPQFQSLQQPQQMTPQQQQLLLQQQQLLRQQLMMQQQNGMFGQGFSNQMTPMVMNPMMMPQTTQSNRMQSPHLQANSPQMSGFRPQRPQQNNQRAWTTSLTQQERMKVIQQLSQAVHRALPEQNPEKIENLAKSLEQHIFDRATSRQAYADHVNHQLQNIQEKALQTANGEGQLQNANGSPNTQQVRAQLGQDLGTMNQMQSMQQMRQEQPLFSPTDDFFSQPLDNIGSQDESPRNEPQQENTLERASPDNSNQRIFEGVRVTVLDLTEEEKQTVREHMQNAHSLLNAMGTIVSLLYAHGGNAESKRIEMLTQLQASLKAQIEGLKQDLYFIRPKTLLELPPSLQHMTNYAQNLAARNNQLGTSPGLSLAMSPPLNTASLAMQGGLTPNLQAVQQMNQQQMNQMGQQQMRPQNQGQPVTGPGSPHVRPATVGSPRLTAASPQIQNRRFAPQMINQQFIMQTQQYQQQLQTIGQNLAQLAQMQQRQRLTPEQANALSQRQQFLMAQQQMIQLNLRNLQMNQQNMMRPRPQGDVQIMNMAGLNQQQDTRLPAQNPTGQQARPDALQLQRMMQQRQMQMQMDPSMRQMQMQMDPMQLQQLQQRQMQMQLQMQMQTTEPGQTQFMLQQPILSPQLGTGSPQPDTNSPNATKKAQTPNSSPPANNPSPALSNAKPAPAIPQKTLNMNFMPTPSPGTNLGQPPLDDISLVPSEKWDDLILPTTKTQSLDVSGLEEVSEVNLDEFFDFGDNELKSNSRPQDDVDSFFNFDEPAKKRPRDNEEQENVKKQRHAVLDQELMNLKQNGVLKHNVQDKDDGTVIELTLDQCKLSIHLSSIKTYEDGKLNKTNTGIKQVDTVSSRSEHAEKLRQLSSYRRPSLTLTQLVMRAQEIVQEQLY
ncbi:hypothetical protein EDD86DRAFT_207044, partial [Gorgonomyces haynaldii]